jgi:hypothetical protein
MIWLFTFLLFPDLFFSSEAAFLFQTFGLLRN